MSHATRSVADRRPALLASKVPEITVYFWIIKVLTTGMGETASDFLVRHLPAMLAVGLGGIAFAAALAVQYSARRYVAWVYWSAVVMVSVFGTMAADVVHVGLGVPYAVSTVVFSLALAAIFAGWYASERTLDIHSIRTRRRETFYWATVLATFALGTAAGDMTAMTMRLGFFVSAIGYGVLIAIPALAFRGGWIGEVLAFWSAYVVTRPLGASIADWMALPHARGGLGLGTGVVTGVWTLAIVALVAYLAVRGKDEQAPAAMQPVPAEAAD